MISPRTLLSIAAMLMLTVVSACGVADDPGAGERLTSDQRPAERFLAAPGDPRPVVLPEDASPHDRLTEWWYYTGHLEDRDGILYGFQFVIFQVNRGDFPPLYAAHFAVTDTGTGTFQFAERSVSFAYRPGELPFGFDLDGWELSGGDGLDSIRADMADYSIDIRLISEKPPVLHEGDGFFEFAPGAASYYYSRTRMAADGVLTVHGEEKQVTGSAWFDQQWGDFLVLDNVGWDWFSVQLDNGQELMAWRSHDGQGTTLDGNATIVRRDGTAIDVPLEDLDIRAHREWTSPRTGISYPVSWVISIEKLDLTLEIEPVMDAQELVTVETTGVIYWEGMVSATGTWEGEEVEGLGYVELTGYSAESPEP